MKPPGIEDIASPIPFFYSELSFNLLYNAIHGGCEAISGPKPKLGARLARDREKWESLVAPLRVTWLIKDR